MSQQWRERPSSLVGLSDDPYLAYCFDEAVYMFGRHCEHEMQAAEDRTKSVNNKTSARQRALTNILDARTEAEESDSPAAEPKKFRDPAVMFKK